MLRIVIAALLLVSLADAAQAGFIIGAIVAAVGITGTAATIATAVGTVALSFGLSYVAGQLLKPPDAIPAAVPAGGAKLDLRVDADVPRSILFGRAVTAGSLVYANTYGSRGEIDNNHLIEIFALADHPCEEIESYIYVEGKKHGYSVAENPARGFEVNSYGGDLAFKFYDGTQTEADERSVDAFGADSVRPWTVDMVGHGITYTRIDCVYNRTKITGPLQFKWVVKGIKLYDPRKDTSVGGSGAHRFTNLATHEWTDNVMVMIYNIMRGIYVLDGSGNRKHLYGLERTAAADLPLSEWFAAMNACDLDMSETDTTNRYRAGGEITVDTEPREAVLELLKCCGGRIIELGGVFKPYIDTPELPVYSFTDDDVLDAEDAFKPFLPLEQRVNYVTGSYTGPNWAPKVAPPRSDAALEAIDGRRLPSDLDAPMVQYGPQMQRLMRQYLLRARRERKHVLTLPPPAFRVEPGQVVSWNSARNGYTDKLFEVDAIDYHGNLCVTLSLTEVDPEDYDWEDAFELPESDIELPSNVPEPKVISGFTATGTTENGDLGTKKPAIRLEWTDPEDADISRVVFQVRRPTHPLNVYTGDSNEPESGALVIVAGLAPLTDYEVRARFDSISGYEAAWSLWIPVTTPDARLTINDFEEALRREITDGIDGRLQLVRDNQELLAGLLAELQSSNALDKTELITKVEKSRDNLRAAYTEAITLAVGPDSAIGQAIQSLEVQVGEISAGGSARFVVGVIPSDAVAAYDLELQAEGTKAGMQIVARNEGGNRSSHIRFDAESVLFGKSGEDGSFRTIFVVDNSTTPPRILIDGNVLAAGSVQAASLAVARLSSIVADLGTVTAGRMLFTSAQGRIDITSSPPRILISQEVS